MSNKTESIDKSDVIGTIVIITVLILVTVHFVQTGGLPAFFARF